MSERLPLSLRTIMELQDTIISALAVMAFLSVPVILGFVLYNTQHIRKDLNREFQSLRTDMRQEMSSLRKDISADISKINSRLGRIEGQLFAMHQPPSSNE